MKQTPESCPLTGEGTEGRPCLPPAPHQVRTRREDPAPCPLPPAPCQVRTRREDCGLSRALAPLPWTLTSDASLQNGGHQCVSLTSPVSGILLYLPQLQQNSLFAFSLKILIILFVGQKLLKTAHNLSLGSDLVSVILIGHELLTLMDRISCSQW